MAAAKALAVKLAILREDALLNRSAIVVKPKQPFLNWLHTADPTSHRLMLRDLTREPTIYLIPDKIGFRQCEFSPLRRLFGCHHDTGDPA